MAVDVMDAGAAGSTGLVTLGAPAAPAILARPFTVAAGGAAEFGPTVCAPAAMAFERLVFIDFQTGHSNHWRPNAQQSSPLFRRRREQW